MNPDLFSSRTLRSASWGQQVSQIMAAAINAVDPYRAVYQYLQELSQKTDLEKYEQIYVVGAGKAGLPMSKAVSALLGEKITAGQVTVKEGHNDGMGTMDRIRIIEAAHPLPDQRGVGSTKEILTLLENTTENDLVICLISGGGSALLTAPVHGVSLKDLRSLTEALLTCGASINEINTLRKQLDIVKGGGLARAAAPSEILTLILSDVVGDPLDMIASGPTVPNLQTPEDVFAVIEKYQLESKVPMGILKFLNHPVIEPHFPGTLKIKNILVGNNETAARASLSQAKKYGYSTHLLTTQLQGEACLEGQKLADILLKTDMQRPFLMVAGGETTVTLKGNGLGGRNQELALATVESLAGYSNLALISLATDGGDGPTDAAGAVVTGETFGRAISLGLFPEDFLSNNDSYNFFSPLGDLLRLGPTQTNVNDLVFLFGF